MTYPQSSFYARLEARRAAAVFPAIMGVTGGLEGVSNAVCGLDLSSPYCGLGEALLVLCAGCLDAPCAMDAGAGRGTSRVWATRP